MKRIFFYTPHSNNNKGTFRGEGRILQILKENLSTDVEYIDNLQQVNFESTLFVTSWQPFSPPRCNKRFAMRQILMIFDVIPLKYPSHFPIGIKGTINLWRNKRALRNFDKIITISEHSKKDISQYLNIPLDKIAVVYPAISNIFINSKNQITSNKQVPKSNNQNNLEIENWKLIENCKLKIENSRYCVYVGDVNWNKNLINLAKAIKKADLPCVFVGKPFFPGTWNLKHETLNHQKVSGFRLQASLDHPWQREFKQFLQEVGDDKRFIFAGYVEDHELIELYKNAVCNILVSRDEGFGYSYAEAASQHCPSILSDADIFHEIAADTALFADPNDPDDIAAQITLLSSNEELRNDLGQKAYKHATKLYSPDVFTRQLESIFVE